MNMNTHAYIVETKLIQVSGIWALILIRYR